MSSGRGVRRGRDEEEQHIDEEEEEEEVEDDDEEGDEEGDEDEEHTGDEEGEEEQEEEEEEEEAVGSEVEGEAQDEEELVSGDDQPIKTNDFNDDNTPSPPQDYDDDERDDGEEEGLSPSPPSTSLPPFSFTTASSTPAPFSFSTSSSFPAPSSSSLSSTPFTFPSFTPGQSASSSSPSTPFTFTSSQSTPAFAIGSSSSAPSFPFGPSSTTAPAPSFAFGSTSIPSTSASSSPALSTFGAQATSTSSSSSTSSSMFAASPSTSSVSFFSAAPASTSIPAGSIVVPNSAKPIASVWGRGDSLFLYPLHTKSSHPNNQPLPSSSSSSVYHFSWPTVYGETTTLLHSWHTVYNNLHSSLPPKPSSLPYRTFLLTQSHCYRAELEASLYRAAQSLNSHSLASELSRHRITRDEYHAQLLLLETAASTWHLFELMCLDPHDNLTVQLVDWLHRSVGGARVEGEVDSDEWWRGVLSLLVQGRLDHVVQLLKEAIDAPSSPLSFLPNEALERLVQLVQSLPSLSAHATSVSHLISLVRDYHLSIQHLATSTPAFQSHPYLPILLSVLTGDEAALPVLCDDWMQLVVAHLIFVAPHTAKSELPDIVLQCVKEMEKEREDEGVSPPPLLSQLRQHILCFRVHQAVLLADQLFELPFFTAHLVDLLTLAHVMPTLKPDPDSFTPRDWYCWQYSLSILYHPSLWPITVDYILSITSPSFSPVHALTSRVLEERCESVKELLHLLAWCEGRVPEMVKERLCERWGNRMMKAGQVGSAVYWWERGGENGKKRVQQIATRLLDQLILSSPPRNDRMHDRISDGVSDTVSGSAEEAEAAMEGVLDNVDKVRLDEETGTANIILLQQWHEYNLIRQQLTQPTSHPLTSSSPPNVFQSDLTSSSMTDVAGRDERLPLVQSAIVLLLSLLIDPLVQADGGGVQFTGQVYHLSLLRELVGWMKEVGVEGVGMMSECSVVALEDVMNVMNRCEVSWRWEEWKRRVGVGEEEVTEVRRVLLAWLQAAIMAEESAKRLKVRV